MRSLWVIIFVFSFFVGKAQSDSSVVKSQSDSMPEKQYDPVFRPLFGLGVGNFTYIGDVANNYKGFNYFVSRIGYELKVTHKLTDYMDLGFYVIFGKVSANERDGVRNLNFESQIRTGGAILSYNFHHILPAKRKVEPYLFAGFESFEFLSKTDLYDRYGNMYYYWSDGSIRNIDEQAANAGQAIMINRDYKYESDLREQNLDGFGKYRERSWALPIGVGITFLISDRVKFKVGTSMHYTFTDLVDNVSSESIGDRKGDSKNDKFMYSSFSLHYDFFSKKDPKLPKEEIQEEEEDGPMVLDMTDLDKDGIRDFKDDCLNTPDGVKVDAKGCPFDKDRDYVFDYMDDELPTPKGNFVNEKGVTLSDQDIEMMYLKYMDSTGQYHGGFQTIDKEIVGDGDPRQIINKNNPKQNLTYFVILGSEKKQIGANDLYKYLSHKDFRQIESGDTIFYVIGDFATVADAIKEKEKLEKEGLNSKGIGESNSKDNTIHQMNNNEIANTLNKEKNNNNTNSGNDEVVFRIQIGAFDKKLSNQVFKDVPDLLSLTDDKGITRYYSGSFTDINKAAERKVDLLEKGFESSFIVAFKNNQRISLKEAGGHLVNESEVENISNTNEVSKVDPEKVKFKVQIGAFKNDIPSKVLDVYLRLGKIQPRRTENGLTIYLHGELNSYDEAEQLKRKIVEMGLGDAFVVGEFNGSVIPAQEAIMLKGGK